MRPPMRYFIIKISKLEDKERIKNSERKTICWVQGNPHKTIRFFSRNFAGQKEAVRYIQSVERKIKTVKQEYSTWQTCPSELKEK